MSLVASVFLATFSRRRMVPVAHPTMIRSSASKRRRTGAPRSLRRVAVGLVVAVAAASSAAACATSSESESTAGGSGGCLGCDAAGLNDVVVDVVLPSVDVRPPTEGGAHHPLCGPGCLPDDPSACHAFDGGPVVDSGASGAGGGGGAGGSDASASADGASGSGGQGTGGASGAAGLGGAPSAEGGLDAMAKIIEAGSPVPPPPEGKPTSSDAGRPPEPAFGCHVRRRLGVPASVCEPAGAGRTGDPCMTSSDCAAGHGCVGKFGAGTCRAYCCADAECDPGSYCAERPSRDDAEPGGESVLVPVCAAADSCSLAEPYPCPSAQTCTCPPETACTIVRPDGTTSCLPPGKGAAGDPCPCAAGHICSMATNHCLKICALAGASDECGSGKCQASSGFPDGFGVCVGGGGDGG